MPSLNVIKYIRPCMESVLKQTLKDIEILAIDAGSNDGTLEILEEYATLDSRVQVIHSDKKSYGYQLNLGILLAHGEYVGIVETDDMIMPDMYETLYDAAIETDAEYVKGRAEYFIEVTNGNIWNRPIRSSFVDDGLLGKVISPGNMPELLVRDIYLWTGLYKREFIKSIRLNETPGAAFQDQGFLFQTISFAKRAIYLDKIVYQYRQDNGNSSIFNKKGFHYLVEEYSYVEQFLQGKSEAWQNVYYQRMFNQCIGRFEMMAVSGSFWQEAERDIETLREKLQYAVDNKLLQINDLSMQRREMLAVFLKGAQGIYLYCVNAFQKMVQPIAEIFDKIEKQQVVIFGVGKFGRFFHALLETKHPGLAVSYCDNKQELWNTMVQGMRILSPEEACRKYSQAIYVIANLHSVEEIEKQLYKLGVSKDKIIIYQGPTDMLLFRMSK